MKFAWDEVKRLTNIHKHGIDFVDAVRVFDGDTFTVEDERFDYSERRYRTIGMLGTVPVLVVHTYTDDQTIHIISVRKLTKHEQRRLFT